MLFWIFYPTYSQLMVDFHKSSKIVPTEKFSKQPIDLLAGEFRVVFKVRMFDSYKSFRLYHLKISNLKF